MVVLLTADTVGGVWTYALSLASALAPHGIFFELATFGNPLAQAQWAEANALPNVRIHESAYKLEWMPDPWADVDASGDWLLDLERELRPDIVHLNAAYAHATLPFAAPIFVVGHSCVLSWWQAVKDEPAPPEWNEYARRVRNGLRAAQVIAAPTDAMANALCRYYGPFPKTQSVLTLPNCADPERFRFAAPEAKERFVFSAGRVWDEAKNIALLDAVASDLPFPVYIAGDQIEPVYIAGDQIEPGRESDAPLSGCGPCRCVRLGKLAPDDLVAYLHRAAVYAAPARYEPFGLAILEAAFSGCALVLGDIGSLRDVWGDAACYVPANCPHQWQDALCKLMDDDAARAELAARANERAHALYTPPVFAQNYVRAYEAVVRL